MIKIKNSKVLSLAAVGLVVASLAVFQACSKKGVGADIPEVEPPVTSATPTTLLALSTTQSEFRPMAVTIAELKSRFYSAGPTQISGLLDQIDTRLSEINTRSAESTRACLSAEAVAYDITVFGETVTTYMQCYDVFSETGGMLFGKKDNTWYLYTNVGQSRVIAKTTPVTGAEGKYEVEAWVSVGQGNSADASTCSSSWAGCSYGVIHLRANSNTNILEMTTGGTGLGFCSAHIRTDGTNLFIKGQSGSLNMPSTTSWGCDTVSELCVATSDLATAGTCTSINASTFALTTLGVAGATTFGNNVTITGATTDSVHFGPSVTELQAITGVAAF